MADQAPQTIECPKCRHKFSATQAFEEHIELEARKIAEIKASKAEKHFEEELVKARQEDARKLDAKAASMAEEMMSSYTENLSEEKDLFFNIKYSGFDMQGNRYSLESEEAYVDDSNPEIVYMKIVNAVFYFKDNTILYVKADKGIYNNKTLDMKFEQNVNANYLESELFAEKAEYSNSKSFLSIYENVRINDIKGNLIADKLLFDITDQKLNITSFSNGKINANVKLNEKRF